MEKKGRIRRKSVVPPPLHALGHFKSVWKAEEVGKGEPLTTNSLLGEKKKNFLDWKTSQLGSTYTVVQPGSLATVRSSQVPCKDSTQTVARTAIVGE